MREQYILLTSFSQWPNDSRVLCRTIASYIMVSVSFWSNRDDVPTNISRHCLMADVISRKGNLVSRQPTTEMNSHRWTAGRAALPLIIIQTSCSNNHPLYTRWSSARDRCLGRRWARMFGVKRRCGGSSGWYRSYKPHQHSLELWKVRHSRHVYITYRNCWFLISLESLQNSAATRGE